jgi:hypothetical protein
MADKEQITALVMRSRNLHAADRHERLGDALLHWIEDPLRPKANNGNLRINPMLLLLALMALLAGGTFLFFSFVQL